MKLKISEASAKKVVLEYLYLQEKMGRCYVIRNNSVAGKLIRPNGSVGWIQNAKAGSPDIIVLVHGGSWVGVEIKSSSGKLSPEQISAKERIKKLGGTYIVAQGIIDVEQLFEK